MKFHTFVLAIIASAFILLGGYCLVVVLMEEHYTSGLEGALLIISLGMGAAYTAYCSHNQ